MKVYWPTRGIARIGGDVLGWKVEENVLVVVSITQGTSPIVTGHDTLAPLVHLGKVYVMDTQSSKEEDANSRDGLVFWVDSKGLPSASNQPVQFILLDPPDTSRLRFFSLGEAEGESNGNPTGSAGPDSHHSAIEKVLPFLNNVHQAQLNRTSMERQRHEERKEPIPRGPKIQYKDTAGRAKSTAISTYLERGLNSVRKNSAIIEQMTLRTTQMVTTPSRLRDTLHRPGVVLAVRSKRYMSFWNTVWLVLNDLILGYCARQLILHASPAIIPTITAFLPEYACGYILTALRWLNDWPIGLKLNTPLSQFFSHSLGGLVQSWSDTIFPIVGQHLSSILSIVSWISLGGLTFTLAATQDLMALVTLHLYVCYILTSTICRWQLSSLGSLWNLFRGKRWNVLRQRTDSYAYDVDQLFLGTLLFTVSIFLLPTVVIYALLFALIRVALLFAYRVLDLGISALNAFPLFELMLRVKEPSRLPGGITFEHRIAKSVDAMQTNPGASHITHILQIKNKPRSFADILSSHRNA